MELRPPPNRANNSPDSCLRHMINLSQSILCKVVWIGSYFINLFPRQFARGTPITSCAPALYAHVVSILLRGSNPQMIRIHTNSIVTTMTHIQPGGNWPIVENPRSDVRPNITSSPCSFINRPISTSSIIGTVPKPAIIRFNYLTPESFFKGFAKSLRKCSILSKYSTHIKSSLSFVFDVFARIQHQLDRALPDEIKSFYFPVKT